MPSFLYISLATLGQTPVAGTLMVNDARHHRSRPELGANSLPRALWYIALRLEHDDWLTT